MRNEVGLCARCHSTNFTCLTIRYLNCVIVRWTLQRIKNICFRQELEPQLIYNCVSPEKHQQFQLLFVENWLRNFKFKFACYNFPVTQMTLQITSERVEKWKQIKTPANQVEENIEAKEWMLRCCIVCLVMIVAILHCSKFKCRRSSLVALTEHFQQTIRLLLCCVCNDGSCYE